MYFCYLSVCVSTYVFLHTHGDVPRGQKRALKFSGAEIIGSYSPLDIGVRNELWSSASEATRTLAF